MDHITLTVSVPAVRASAPGVVVAAPAMAVPIPKVPAVVGVPVGPAAVPAVSAVAPAADPASPAVVPAVSAVAPVTPPNAEPAAPTVGPATITVDAALPNAILVALEAADKMVNKVQSAALFIEKQCETVDRKHQNLSRLLEEAKECAEETKGHTNDALMAANSSKKAAKSAGLILEGTCQQAIKATASAAAAAASAAAVVDCAGGGGPARRNSDGDSSNFEGRSLPPTELEAPTPQRRRLSHKQPLNW